MELRRLWLLIWHRKLLIVLMVAAAIAAGYETTPKVSNYEAVSTLFVGDPQYNAGGFSSDLQQGTQELADTFATMVPSLSVAEAAVEATGVARAPGQVVGETRSFVYPDTTLIYIEVVDPDPVVAQSLANGMAQAFVTQIAKLDPVTTDANGGAIPAQSPASVFQLAFLPSVPLSDGLGRNLILSGLFGLLAAAGLVLLLDYLDLTVRSPDDLERRVGLPVLGVIPFYADSLEQDFVVGTGRPSRVAGLASTLDG